MLDQAAKPQCCSPPQTAVKSDKWRQILKAAIRQFRSFLPYVTVGVAIGIFLMAKGMSMGAVLALIIGGAEASIPEMVMLNRLFKLPVLAVFLATVFGMAVSAGLLVNYLNG